MSMKKTTRAWWAAGLILFAAAGWTGAQTQAVQNAGAADEDDGSADHQAMRLFRQGVALLDDKQDERGVKTLGSIVVNFPKSPVRLQAGLRLGTYYAEKGDFQMGIKSVQAVSEAEEASPDEKAEALYRMGVCYYGLADYGRSLSTLRRVTEEFPWSVFANESFYYIGLCHFQLKRWRKAVEALKMVGTSVPPNVDKENFVESGQRFFVKVNDKDLRVLKESGASLVVATSTESGDKETSPMEIFDSEGEFYLGSLKMELGAPKPGDGALQVRGGDRIKVEYRDANAQDGSLNVGRLASSRVVSTAVAGFMDGAYRQYVHGVFGDQKTFVRVKDFDADKTEARDSVKVRLTSRYKVEQLSEGGTSTDAVEYVDRDASEVTLQETEPHSGFFSATVVIKLAETNATINTADADLSAVEGDYVYVEYMDQEHIGGLTDPRKVWARAEFLTGEIPDVWVAQREVSTEMLRARKNLIEAKFYLRLAQIFREVGLTDRASNKADVGIEKVDDVLRRSLRASLSQDVVEESYQLKWELQLAKGDLGGAINTCRTLMSMFPSSTLADVALMQIARANIDAGKSKDALQILRGIAGLKGNPELKAEAQFLIAQTLEKGISSRLGKEERLRAMGPVVDAYRTCADQFPDSPFAGEALGKVIDFHLEVRDYERCLELLQQVFVDFPDAPFLDEMLLKWGVVLVKVGQKDAAKEKLGQLLSDYPNSAAAGKAQKVLELINR